MVDSVFDPTNIPTITLSGEELDEIEMRIEAGELPPDYILRYYEAVRKNVFGADHKTDKAGNPVEQGLGSAFNQTKQSVAAYRKWNSNEPDYEKNLARMEAELAAADTRCAAERSDAKPNKYGRL
jgi:hypothetical protein